MIAIAAHRPHPQRSRYIPYRRNTPPNRNNLPLAAIPLASACLSSDLLPL